MHGLLIISYACCTRGEIWVFASVSSKRNIRQVKAIHLYYNVIMRFPQLKGEKQASS